MKPLSLLVLSTLCTAAAAQAPLPAFDSLMLDWSVSEPGPSTAITTGAFVQDHPGHSVAALRGGALYWAFEPDVFERIDEVPTPLGVGQTLETIAVLPALGGGQDRLAVVTSAGFDLWRYDSLTGAFVSCLVGGNNEPVPLAGFIGATELRCGTHTVSGVAQNHVLAIGPNWVRGIVVLDDDSAFPGAVVTIAGGQTLLDGAVLQWQAGGLPEVGVLSTNGMFVFDVFANALASQPFTCTTGKLVATTTSTDRALCAVTDSGSDYILRTWLAGGGLTPSATFSMPAPAVGIVTLDLDQDGQLDIVVTSTDSVMRCFEGGGSGPDVNSNQYDVNIVDPASLPTSPADNTVRPVVDDVDHDGYLDIVFSHRATDQLLVMHSVPRSYQVEALNQPDPGDAKDPMGAPIALFSSEDANWAFPSTMHSIAHDGAGLRVALPGWVTDDHLLRVFRYPVLPATTSEPAKVNMNALGVYDYQLATTYASRDFDFLVPVAARVSATEVHEMLEVMIVNGDDTEACPPALIEYRVTGGTGLADLPWWNGAFGDLADWGWLWVIGWPIDIGPTRQMWFGTSTVPAEPTPVTDPGDDDPPIPSASRYIGVMVAMDIVLSDDLPSLPQKEAVTSGMIR